MSDREEIRWNFQVMIENTKFVIDGLNDLWRNFDEQAERALRKVERKRNYRLTGIGVAITVILTLVATGTLKDYEQIGIITVGVLGFLALIFFVYTERILEKEESVQKEINDLFFNIKNQKLVPAMGTIATLAIDKTITEEQIETIQIYESTNMRAKDYLFRWELYQILIKNMSKEQRKEIDLARFSHSTFKETYIGIKEKLDLFKKSTLVFETNDIDEFVKVYEKNSKTKT